MGSSSLGNYVFHMAVKAAVSVGDDTMKMDILNVKKCRLY